MKERERETTKQHQTKHTKHAIYETIKTLKLSEKTINNYQTRTCTYRIYQNGNNLCNFRLEQTRKKHSKQKFNQTLRVLNKTLFDF